MQPARIMVVEDEVVVSKGIQAAIAAMGLEICGAATSGREAIEKATLHQPDLVLMDIALKGSMDGIEAAGQIKRNLGIPIVFLTAYADNAKLERAKLTEPFGYLIKPFEDRELKATLDMALYKAQAEAQIRAREEWAATALGSIGDAVITTDIQGRITFMNPLAESMTGWSREEASGVNLRDVFRIINEETRKPVESPVDKVLRHGGVVGLANHTLLISKDGVETPIDDSGSPIHNRQGELTGIVLVFRDVTEHRRAANQLAASHALLNSVVEGTSDVIFVKDLKGDYLLANSAMAEVRNLPINEVLGKNDYDLFTAEIADRLREADFEVIQSGKSIYREEISTHDQSGEEHKWLTTKSPYKDQNGNIIGVIGVAHDITEITNIQEELQHSEEMFRQAFDNASVGISITGVDGRLRRVNPQLCKMLGYRREELEGKHFNDITHHEDHSIGDEFVRKTVSGDLESARFEKRYLHKDGHPVWVDVAASLVRDKEGSPETFIVQFLDISARKKAEAALEKQSRLLELSQKIAKLGAWEYDLQTGDYTLTAELSALVGIEENEPSARIEFLSYFLPASRTRLEQAIEAAQSRGEPFDLELELNTALGRRIWARIIGNGVFENDVCVKLTGSFQDITDLKNTEFERNQLENQLRQAQKMEAIGTLAGGIAHDFNNILAAIVGYTELSAQQQEPGSESHKYLQHVLQASERAKKLISQILAFSRQRKIKKQPVNIALVVKEVSKLLRATLPPTIDIEIELASEPGNVLADPTQIHQVLMNLCTNSAHAMRPEGGTLWLSLEGVEVKPKDQSFPVNLLPGRYVALQVGDSGKGMSSSILDRIFDPYFTTKTPEEGTGLGLAVVHGIVKSLGGEIAVQSEPRKGTTFTLYFPVHEDDESKAPVGYEAESAGGETILFVDDEEAIVDVVTQQLTRLGYRVVPFTDPEQAWHHFTANRDKYDLVLTDYYMRSLTGQDLVKRMRAIGYKGPVVFYTGSGECLTSDDVKMIDISAVCMKPQGAKELGRVLRSVFDNPKQKI